MIKNGLFNFCVFGMVFSILVSICAGYYYRDVSGYILFGILLSSILSNIAVIVSLFCNKIKFIVARYFWIFLAVAVLMIAFISSFNAYEKSDVGIVIGYPMTFLSAPLGIVGGIIFSQFPSIRPEHYFLGDLYDWLLFFIFGYVQWFILAPLIVRGEIPGFKIKKTE